MKVGDQTYKNHVDGYNQLDMLLGKGPSARHEIFYFGGPKLGAIRIDSMKFRFHEQPAGWTGPKLYADMPLRGAPGYMMDFFAREFWRFVLVQDRVAELAKTAIDYPPMQDRPPSTVKRQIEAAIKEHGGG